MMRYDLQHFSKRCISGMASKLGDTLGLEINAKTRVKMEDNSLTML